MDCRFPRAFGQIALAALITTFAGHGFLQGREKTRPAKQSNKGNAKNPQAWTLEEALARLRTSPHDPYLQYVALQLARREKQLKTVAHEVEELTAPEELFGARGRGTQVDLFSLFTGALAVQESLQLDTMRGNPTQLHRGRAPVIAEPEKKGEDPKDVERKWRAAQEKRRRQVVAVSRLRGPAVKSHPWKKMLAGKRPEVSRLSRAVPADFYLAEFRSLGKLLDVIDNNDLWGKHLFNQAVREAWTQGIGARLKTQLVLETNSLLRPFYDLVVEEVAVTGSDLFFREGSDVTLLFRFKKPALFKARMDAFARNVEKARPGVKRSTGKYLGVDYVHLSTPDRAVSVYAAYPEKGLHVRSNSLTAFRRIVEAVQGKDARGKAVRRLGETNEFKYIRTLMPRGAKEEDGFVYLSDPFIRRLVGPQLKLTELRRLLCYNHLKMIGHAALLYRTEHGEPPASLEALAKANCCPGKFNHGNLACPCGGKYSLSEGGMSGVCSHHGNAHFLTPCCEIPLTKVNGLEADAYRDFVKEYNQYWKTYFDPIALRIQISPRRYRLETIVLPLIDNSIYSMLAHLLKGKPEALDGLPVPKRNILSVNVRFNKKALHKKVVNWLEDEVAKNQAAFLFQHEQALSKGLGNQLGFHVYDADPLLDLNIPGFLGMMLGQTTNSSGGIPSNFIDPESLFAAFAVTSVATPVYYSVPVRNAKLVDRLLAAIDKRLAIRVRQVENSWGLRFDFYTFTLRRKHKARALGVRFGPVKWRFFWARIGKGLYIASKPVILEDLAALETAPAKTVKRERTPDRGPRGHAMVRLRPQNWKRVLAAYRLSWAENNREACLNNLVPIANAGRALAAGKEGAKGSWDERGKRAHAFADRLYGVHFYCPEGGRYLLSPDGKTCKCSVHGTPEAPKQPARPDERSQLGRLMKEFADLTATLTFLEDGLHAVVTIDRKPD
jgi:hypothetical protein